MISHRDADFLMSPKISDNISMDLDYRTQFLYSEQKNRADFQSMSGAFYTNLALSKKINIVGKYDFITRIWEGYGVEHKLPGIGYIEVGAFTPSYEVRIDDHTAFTRGYDLGLLFSEGAYQRLIYNPSNTETGEEVVMFGGRFPFANASNGSNLLSNRTLTKGLTYTARVELTPSLNQFHFLIGGF